MLFPSAKLVPGFPNTTYTETVFSECGGPQARQASLPGSRNVPIYAGRLEDRGVLSDPREKRCNGHAHCLNCYLCFFCGIILGILNKTGALFLALVGRTGRLPPCWLFNRR